MLWNLQFFISALFVAGYGLMISRLAFRYVVPAVYAIFALSFVAFYFIHPALRDPSLIEKTFYIWVSTFSLFHLSVFWSLMSDTFSRDQGKRLFAIIAAGGSAGAIIGPMVPILFSESLGLESLMLLAALGIASVIPLVWILNRFKHQQTGQPAAIESNSPRLGGTWWQGFRDVLKNRYLLTIAVFILLYVFIGSFVYFEQKNLLADYSRPERAKILGSIDWIVNTLTFGIAFFATGRIVTRLGMPIALLSVPILLMAGMLALIVAPSVIVILIIQIVRRVGNYSVTRPAREMLFSRVSREARFKAKPGDRCRCLSRR